MDTDDQGLSGFYATPRGGAALALVRARLERLWPDLRGQVVLGLGYGSPYLSSWPSARCVAGSVGVPPAEPQGQGCVVELGALPFADLSVDRVLLVHGLETAENARRALREVWRVLKDDGRLMVVVPNRVGVWAHVDSTPFGQGQPYSAGQVDRLLTGTLFRVERRDRALYVPPTANRAVLRSAAWIERAGRRVTPHLAGVLIAEAVKDAYAALPLRAVPRRRFVLAEAA